MNIGDKIKSLRKKKGLTLEAVAQFVGVSRATVMKWENGMIANMRRDRIAKLAQVLGTTPSALIYEEGHDMVVPDDILPISKKRFPLVGEIACGEPSYAEELYETYVSGSSSIDADCCLVARGNSMIDARIHDGDVVFIKRQDVVDNGQIAAVIIGDEATLKYWDYNQEKKRLILTPANTAYRPLIFEGDELENVRCLGLAVAFTSRL